MKNLRQSSQDKPDINLVGPGTWENVDSTSMNAAIDMIAILLPISWHRPLAIRVQELGAHAIPMTISEPEIKAMRDGLLFFLTSLQVQAVPPLKQQKPIAVTVQAFTQKLVSHECGYNGHLGSRR